MESVTAVNLKHRPELNLRAERTKPYGLRPQPQRGFVL